MLSKNNTGIEKWEVITSISQAETTRDQLNNFTAFYYLCGYRRSRYCDHPVCLCVSVCLSVCPSVCRITQERVDGCRPNLVSMGGDDPLEAIKFWCGSDSASGSSDPGSLFHFC